MPRLLPLLAVIALVLGVAAAATGEEGEAASARRALIKTSLGDIEVELWPDVAPRTVANFLGLADGKGSFTDVRDAANVVEINKPFYDGLIFHRVIDNFMLQTGCPRGNGTGDAGYWFEDEINAKLLGLDKEMVLKGGQPHPWLGVRSQVDWQRNVLVPVLKHLKIDLQDVAAQQTRQAEIKSTLESLTLLELYEMQGYEYDGKLPSKRPLAGYLAMANSGPNTNGSQFFINLVDTPWLTGRHTVFGRVVKGMDVAKKIGKVKVGAGSKPVEDVKILSIRSLP